MNYEELYSELMAVERELKEKLSAAQKYCKSIMAETEKGDLKTLKKDLSTLAEICSEEEKMVNSLRQKVEGFDANTYFEGGDFAEQLLDNCREKGIDVHGTYPIYEVFPYRVRIDGANQDIYLDRKRLQCSRPSELVRQIKLGQDKLMKASFNVQSFLGELANAYDLAIMKGNKPSGAEIYLSGLYRYMVPMARSRREYEMQNYAFDLARLYTSDVKATKEGRQFQFGPSRENNKSVRILAGEGKEVFLSTIRFFDI